MNQFIGRHGIFSKEEFFGILQNTEVAATHFKILVPEREDLRVAFEIVG